MYKWPNDIKQIVGEVLYASNPISCLEQYINVPSARDITFLLFDGKQATNFLSLSYDYSTSKYSLVNLGNYDNTAVISTSILTEPQDAIAIKATYFVNIDSNIASMLSQLIKDKPINNDFLNFLEYVKKEDLNLSLYPYLLEDSLNSSGMKNEALAYECLLSFFCFSKLSLHQLSTLPCTPDSIDYIRADNAWSQMKYSRFHERNKEKRVRSIYCFLLKIYMIEFSSRRKAETKLAELVDFINTDLGVYFEFGVLLAYWYFAKSYNCVTEFFQKIQPSSKDKLKKVEGMAWDLFHLWDIPSEMAIQSSQNHAIVLQALATHDDALAQIAKLNPIIRIAFYNQEAQVKYKLSLSDVLKDNSMIDSIINNQAHREHIFDTVDLLKLSATLEQEFLEQFK